MKTLRLFFSVLLLGLFTLASSAQPPKTVRYSTLTWESISIPCIDENVTGEIEMCNTVWNNKVLNKYKGTLVGETTGNIYTLSLVGNRMYRRFEDGRAGNQTQAQTLSFCLEGVEVFVMHITTHYTVNANGELVSEVTNFISECK